MVAPKSNPYGAPKWTFANFLFLVINIASKVQHRVYSTFMNCTWQFDLFFDENPEISLCAKWSQKCSKTHIVAYSRDRPWVLSARLLPLIFFKTPVVSYMLKALLWLHYYLHGRSNLIVKILPPPMWPQGKSAPKLKMAASRRVRARGPKNIYLSYYHDEPVWPWKGKRNLFLRTFKNF